MAKEQITPRLLEAERALLGALILNSDQLASVLDVMTPDDIWLPEHREIFHAIAGVKRQGLDVDLVTIGAYLERAEKLSVAKPSYVAGLVDGVPKSTHAVSYAELIAQEAQKREAIDLYRESVKALRSADVEIAVALQETSDLIQQIARSHRSTWTPVKQIIWSVNATLGERYELKSQGITGLSTGFIDLDEMTDGLHPGRFYIVAAGTGIGKSALSLNVARNVAARAPVAFVSLEMGATELVQRMVATESQIDLTRVIRGYIRDAEFSRLGHALSLIDELDLHVDDDGTRTVAQVRSFAKHLKLKHGLGLLIVDYLQLLSPGAKRSENRSLEVGKMGRDLKVLAKDLQIPVVAISQLSREPQKGQQPRKPRLSDLRDSGELEQHADQVWLMWRPDPQNPMGKNPRVAEVHVAKNRQGPVGIIELNWIPEQTRFANYSERAA